jgi:hypothetical protein
MLSHAVVHNGLNQSGIQISLALPKLEQTFALDREPPVDDPLSSMTPDNGTHDLPWTVGGNYGVKGLCPESNIVINDAVDAFFHRFCLIISTAAIDFRNILAFNKDVKVWIRQQGLPGSKHPNA